MICQIYSKGSVAVLMSAKLFAVEINCGLMTNCFEGEHNLHAFPGFVAPDIALIAAEHLVLSFIEIIEGQIFHIVWKPYLFNVLPSHGLLYVFWDKLFGKLPFVHQINSFGHHLFLSFIYLTAIPSTIILTRVCRAST